MEIEALKERRGAEKWFWDVVDFADWPLHQYVAKDDGKIQMMALLTPEEGERFHYILQAKTQKLKTALDMHVASGGSVLELGDDGLDDVVKHIIGLGQDEFRRALRDPQRLVDRGQCGDFSESFSYVVPDPMDYELVGGKVDLFAERAATIQSQYRQLFNVPALRYVLPWLREILRLLDCLLAGDWKTFSNEEDRIRRLAGDLTDSVSAIERTHKWRNQPVGLPDSGASEPERQLRELCRDVRRWCVDLPRLRDELRPDCE